MDSCWEGSRNSIPRHGQGRSSQLCHAQLQLGLGRAGILDSASGILLPSSGEIREKESLDMDERKGAGWEDTCDLFLPPP